MNASVIDANVFVALSYEHLDTAAAVAATARYEDLYAPEQIVPEVSNALHRAARNGTASDAQVIAALDVLSVSVHLVTMRDMALDAYAIASRIGHSTYDCFYLVLAQRLNCALISGDRKFLRKAEAVATVPLVDLSDLNGTLL